MGHGHPHEHEHEHEHDQSRERERAGSERSVEHELKRGAGSGRVLFFDTPSGISGDMIVSALLDLGVPLQVVTDAVGRLPLAGYRLERGVRMRQGVACASFEVKVDGGQPERTWKDIDAMIAGATLPEGVAELARRIFRVLGEAEAHVHRAPIESVHFHEVGAVDAIVDIVGAAAMVRWLDAAEVVISPLPIGRGTVQARHGVLPLPAPAALQCMRGIPTYGVDVEAELVTPTGAAIASTIAHRFLHWPAITPERIGIGSGARELERLPNLLRAVLGSSPEPGSGHMVVEANVDDMTGELAGHAIAALMVAGALDVWLTPTTTKKGRPGMTVSALADGVHVEGVWRAMLRETTSIGVRVHQVQRYARPRRVEQVQTSYGEIAVKVSEGDFGPEQAKPEFDVCAAAAERAGVPVREVIAAAVAAWRQR
jgi:pyridinium-3,5-bisthiocarboxylic acid mononucleotide nickel chelatase